MLSPRVGPSTFVATSSGGLGEASTWSVKASNLCIILSKISFYSWNHASNSHRTAVGIALDAILSQWFPSGAEQYLWLKFELYKFITNKFAQNS